MVKVEVIMPDQMISKKSGCRRLEDEIFSNEKPWELIKHPKVTPLALSYLKLAEDSLESSKAIYNIGKYPNSIFELEQSVEKLVKSYSLYIGLLNDNNIKLASHNVFCIFFIMQKIEKTYYEYQKNNQYLPMFVPQYDERMKKRLNEVDRLYKNIRSHKIKSKVDISREDISDILNELNLLQVNWLDIINKTNERKKVLISYLEILSNIDKIIENTNITHDELYSYLNGLNLKAPNNLIAKVDYQNALNSLKTIPQEEKIKAIGVVRGAFEKAFDSIPIVILNQILFYRLLYLSTIIIPHVILSRYPDTENDRDTSIFYNDDLPLLDKYSEISDYVEQCILDLNYIYNENLRRDK